MSKTSKEVNQKPAERAKFLAGARKASRDNPTPLVTAVNPAEISPEAIKPPSKAALHKASVEAVATSLAVFAGEINTAMTSAHATCKGIYARAFDAWRELTENTGRVTSQMVNTFHKDFKRSLLSRTELTDGTIRNLLADCRKANKLPAGKPPRTPAEPPDTISIRINSAVTKEILTDGGEESDDSVDRLYHVLMALYSKYPATFDMAVQKVIDATNEKAA